MRGKFDVAMCWAVDRMGRSLLDLLDSLQELHGAKVDLFLHQQAIDATTPAGRAMFSIIGVFVEFERFMIQARIRTGIARARINQKRRAKPFEHRGCLLRSRRLRAHLVAGLGTCKTARTLDDGVGTVQRVQKESVVVAG